MFMMARFSLRSCLIGITAASVILVMWWGAARYAQHAARRVSCHANGNMIFFAILEYREKYGKHPPQVVLGPNGEPWHSWRVLLLEFIDPATFQKYSFDEPWDSPNNSKLSYLMPSYYRCPLDRRSNPFFTSYVAARAEVVDSKAAWPWEVIEDRQDINWMSPLDGQEEQRFDQIECFPPTRVDHNGVHKR